MKASTSRLKAIHSLQADFGPAGLLIPDLPEDATDDEIFAALAALDAAKAKLLAKRKALAEEAGEVLSSDRDIPDDEADKKSSEIKELLREAKKSITGSKGIGFVWFFWFL